MHYPRFARIKQLFESPPSIADIPRAVHEALRPLELASIIEPRQTVAVTAGSRGVANLPTIIRTIVETLKARGAEPFIVPAMGSHGGATSEGQIDVLRRLGIDEETVQTRIKSSMEVKQVGEALGFPIYIDKLASEADHIVVVARIKPHTDFKGEIESGFFKMMTVGLGKHKGASVFHRASLRYGHTAVLKEFAREILRKTKVAFGLGLVENAYDRTIKIEAAAPKNLEQTEIGLLRLAKSCMMKLPFDDIDVLVVDELGKDVSGDGIDPNVTGRFAASFKHTAGPRINRIAVLDLTEGTHGNAVGIGRADFTTRRLVDKMDRQVTYTNALTSLDPEGAKIPPYFDTDREALTAALDSIGMESPDAARIVRIRNTLRLAEVDVSEAYLPFLKNRRDLRLISEPKELQFDTKGHLSPLTFNDSE